MCTVRPNSTEGQEKDLLQGCAARRTGQQRLRPLKPQRVEKQSFLKGHTVGRGASGRVAGSRTVPGLVDGKVARGLAASVLRRRTVWELCAHDHPEILLSGCFREEPQQRMWGTGSIPGRPQRSCSVTEVDWADKGEGGSRDASSGADGTARDG